MTAPTEDLIADLEALLAGEPVFVVGHPVSRAITALRSLQQEVERLREALEPFSRQGERLFEEDGRWFRKAPFERKQRIFSVEYEDLTVFVQARSALTGSAQG